MAEKKYTEHLGLTQQSEEDFVDGEEISRSFKVLDQEVFSIREKTNNLKNEDHYYSNDYYTFPEKINSITYGEGKYVAAGEYNIYSSIDKRSWIISDSRSGISVAYGNGKYMAVVLHNGYYNLLASSDGIEWSEIQILVDGAQSTRKLNEIIYENEKFIIVGDGGKIYTSDGTQVTEQSSPTSIDLKSISSGNGIFIAVGYKSTTSVLLKSVDAVTWEQVPLSLQFARNQYDKIVFGNGIFVLKDRMRCYTTTDGTDLLAHSTPEPPSGGDVCFAGNQFFLTCRTRNFISTNGIEWTDITKEFAGKITAIEYFNDEIIGATAENILIGINRYTVDSIRSDIAELNSALANKQSYPDYSKIKIAISGGVGTKTYTCTEDGFIQFIGHSGNNSVKPEIDLRINNIGVFTYRTGYQTTYVKATSGLFPVKSGDVIECIIQSSFISSESVRFYPLRY